MKAVIMAAGKGVRMLPLTENIPKVLVEVAGKPFLYYLLRNLQKAGFAEFGLIVGYKKEQFPFFLKKYGFKAELIAQKEQLGTGHAVLQAEKFAGNENFIVLGGDNLWSPEDFNRIAKNDNFCYVSGLKSNNPERYGVLILKNKEFLEKIHEKPKEYVGDLINTGLYKFTPEIFTALKKIGKSPRGEYELTDAISILAKENKVKVVKLRNYWLDLGCIEDIKRIEDFFKKNNLNFD